MQRDLHARHAIPNAPMALGETAFGHPRVWRILAAVCLFATGSASASAQSPRYGDPVMDLHKIYLKLLRMGATDVGSYITTAYSGNESYYPQVGGKPERLMISNYKSAVFNWMKLKDGFEIQNGDTVAITYVGSDHGDWKESWKPYNALYVSEGFTQAAWYVATPKYSHWKIWIKGTDTAAKDVVKYGDTIYIESVQYPGHYLEKTGKWVDANEREQRERGEWQILGPGISDKPPKLIRSGTSKVVHRPMDGVVYMNNIGGEAHTAAETMVQVDLGVEVGFTQESTSQWEVGAEVGFQAGTEANFVTGSASIGYGEAETEARTKVNSANISKSLAVTYNQATDAEILIHYHYSVPWELEDVECGGVNSTMRTLNGNLKLGTVQTITIPSRDRDGNIKPRSWNEIEELLVLFRRTHPIIAEKLEKERKPEWVKNGWVYLGDSPPRAPARQIGETENSDNVEAYGDSSRLMEQSDSLKRAQVMLSDVLAKVPTEQHKFVWGGVGLFGLVGFLGLIKAKRFKWKLAGLVGFLVAGAIGFLGLFPVG